ncbi:MAG TPA: TMEM43 family protein, partial [Acetobacteraceae bacterium]|nr:TMEM43 family protein [Acetobacteraceae bacterium]
FLESMVGAGAFLVALTLAVPITLLTIAIAWIAHRPLVGVGLLVAAAVALFLLGRMHPRRGVVRT